MTELQKAKAFADNIGFRTRVVGGRLWLQDHDEPKPSIVSKEMQAEFAEMYEICYGYAG